MTENYEDEVSMIEGTSNDVGKEMYQFMAELYPICRSITGKGVRETLHLITKHLHNFLSFLNDRKL